MPEDRADAPLPESVDISEATPAPVINYVNYTPAPTQAPIKSSLPPLTPRPTEKPAQGLPLDVVKQKVAKLKDAGYSQDEIAESLMKNPFFGPRISEAADKGWEYPEIFSRFGLDGYDPTEGGPLKTPWRYVKAGVESAGEMIGNTLQGGAIASDRRSLYAPYYEDYTSFKSKSPEEQQQILSKIANSDMDLEARQNLTKEFRRLQEGANPRQFDMLANQPVEQLPGYKVGQWFKDTTQGLLNPEEEKLTGVRIAKAAAPIVPAMAATALAGPAGPMALFGGSSYQEGYEKAKKVGASEEAARDAAMKEAGIGAAAGVLDVGAILGPIAKYSPELLNRAQAILYKGIQSGVIGSSVGEAQKWLNAQIERTTYDPNAQYKFDPTEAAIGFAGMAIPGAVHGAFHEQAPKETAPTGTDIPHPSLIAHAYWRIDELESIYNGTEGNPPRDLTPAEAAEYAFLQKNKNKPEELSKVIRGTEPSEQPEPTQAPTVTPAPTVSKSNKPPKATKAPVQAEIQAQPEAQVQPETQDKVQEAANALVEEAKQNPTVTTPEKDSDISAQIKEMINPNNPRDSVYIAPGNEHEIPVSALDHPGVELAENPVSKALLLTTNMDKAIDFQKNRDLTEEEKANLLGLSQPKTEALKDPNAVVVQGKNEDGAIVHQELTSQDNLPNSVENTANRTPETGQVEVASTTGAQAHRVGGDDQAVPVAKGKVPTPDPEIQIAEIRKQIESFEEHRDQALEVGDTPTAQNWHNRIREANEQIAELQRGQPLEKEPAVQESEPASPQAPSTDIPWENHYQRAVDVVGSESFPLKSKPLADKLGVDEAMATRLLQAMASRGAIRQTKNGGFSRNPDRGPLDFLTFLAAKGGLRDDEGHLLAQSMDAQRMVPNYGPLIRKNGMGIDQAGEALWQAGYFGPTDSTPRPTETEVLNKLSEALNGRLPLEERYSEYDRDRVQKIQDTKTAKDREKLEKTARADIEKLNEEKTYGLTPEEKARAIELLVEHPEDFSPEEAVVHVLDTSMIEDLHGAIDVARDAHDDEFSDIPFEWPAEVEPPQRGEEEGKGTEVSIPTSEEESGTVGKEPGEGERQDLRDKEIGDVIGAGERTAPPMDRERQQAEIRARQAGKKRSGKEQEEPGGMFATEEKGLFSEPKKTADYGTQNKVITADAAEKARELLRKKSNQINAGIDPETMLAGVTLAAYHIEAGTRKFVDFARAMVSDVGAWIKPYLKSWYNAIRDYPGLEEAAKDMTPHEEMNAAMDQLEREGYVSSESRGLEQTGEGPKTENAMGKEALPTEERGASQGVRERNGEAEARGNNKPSSEEQLPSDGASSVGERGNSERDAGEPGFGAVPAERGGRPGGYDVSQHGPAIEHIEPEEVNKTAGDSKTVAQRFAEQKIANSRPVVWNDINNIRETLPALFPDQQDDVHKSEKRLSVAHGIMITNGTGTGKTWSAGGVIARFVRQGKEDILVVAPSQDILTDWKAALKHLGVDASVLEGTQKSGKGVTLTTYANLGENRHIADRNWHLVVADESDNLMSDQKGNTTKALNSFRAITNHPDALYIRADMALRDLNDRVADLSERVHKNYNNKELTSQWINAQRELEQKRKELVDVYKDQPRSKAIFLSATPFSYDKTTDYGNGYLFDYQKEGNRSGYNVAEGRNLFMVQNFGYRMRNGKLTAPEANVNSEVLERDFHERLKKEGALIGRRLEVDSDYDRKFILVNDAIGNNIDRLLEFLRESDDGKFRPIYSFVNDRFDYLSRQRLLEAIKANHAIPIIREHLALGRKVVVFHDFNEGGGFHPFDTSEIPNNPVFVTVNGKSHEFNLKDLANEFHDRNPDAIKMDFSSMKSPIETMTKAFPEALVYNGTVSSKNRATIKQLFNQDGSGRDVIVIQSAAGRAGISLHDTTGVHQRVLINLGMPTRPTTSIQQEGRIYRTGQKSDAMFRYMNTGTAWEREAFASRIAERASSVENLGMGNQARQLKQSFIDAFNDTSEYPPSPEEGKGGKSLDRQTFSDMSDFERAKTYYFAEQKKTGRRDQREGVDYFPTPEPLAQKMVEWANVKPGEKILEPSAGHGAISRYFPESTERTIVEPSKDLATRASLMTPGARVVNDKFENLHISNKYDGIVMNPPFGIGGKMAIEHLAKAASHVREGGRIVALLPEGPATDKRLAAFRDSDAAKDLHLVGTVSLPTHMFDRAGTNVKSHVLIFEKHTVPKQANQYGSDVGDKIRSVVHHADLSNSPSINDTFNRLEHLSMPDRIEPVTKEVEAPEVPSNGKVVVSGLALSSITNKDGSIMVSPTKRLGANDYARFMRVGERYGGVENDYYSGLSFKSPDERSAFFNALERGETGNEPSAEAQRQIDNGGLGVTFDRKQGLREDGAVYEKLHTQTRKKLFYAKPDNRVSPETYQKLKQIAGENGGGFWDRYEKAFRFNDEDSRQAFMNKVTGSLPLKSGDLRVGKKMDALYVHKSAIDTLPKDAQNRIERAKPPFDWDVAKIKRDKDGALENVSLIEAKDFDEADEPSVGRSFVIDRDGETRIIPASGKIYHGKWQMVKSDYQGFDVDASKERTRLLDSVTSTEDKRRYGQKDYMDNVVAPKLSNNAKLADRFLTDRDKVPETVTTLDYNPKDGIVQKISSANTVRRQAAQVFGNDKFYPRSETPSFNLDLGGGKFPEGTERLAEKGITNLIHDKYNQSEQHNRDVVEKVKAEKGTGIVSATNVLNVIKEPMARLDLIRQAAKGLKDDGVAYFQIHEGDKSGEGKETSDGWQANKLTSTYLPMVRQYFGKVKQVGRPDAPKGNLIIAAEPKRIPGQTIWEGTEPWDTKGNTVPMFSGDVRNEHYFPEDGEGLIAHNESLSPGDAELVHNDARAYVLDRGNETGHEHGIAVHSDGRVEHFTEGKEDTLSIKKVAPELYREMEQAGNNIDVHHNHPEGTSAPLSESDLQLSTLDGVNRVIAHAGDGVFSVAKCSDALNQFGNAGDRQKLIRNSYRDALRAIQERIFTGIRDGEISEEGIHNIGDYEHIINMALDRVGLIDYVSNHQIEDTPLNRELAQKAILAAWDSANENGFRVRSSQDAVRLDAKLFHDGTFAEVAKNFGEPSGTLQGGSRGEGRIGETARDYPLERENKSSSQEGAAESLGLKSGDLRTEDEKRGAVTISHVIDKWSAEGPGKGPLRRPVQVLEGAADYVKETLPITSQIWKWASRRIFPGSADAFAKSAARTIRHMYGQSYLWEIQMGHKLDEISNRLDALPVDEWNKIGIAWAKGDYESIPEEYREAFKQADDFTKKATERLQSLGVLKDAMGHYVGRIWKKRGENAPSTDEEGKKIFNQLMSKFPLLGRKSFLKKRYFDEYEDAIAAGMEPVYNPLKTQMVKIAEMNRYYTGTTLVRAAKESGIAKFFARGSQVPDGMLELAGPEFQRPFMKVIEGEKTTSVLPGAWYAPEGFARVYNNHVSRGFSGTPEGEPVQMLRSIGGFMNQAQLGLSMFHPVFTTFDAMSSTMAIAVDQAVRKDFGLAAQTFAKSMNPFGVYKDGDNFLKAVLDPDKATPDQKLLINALGEGGGRVWMERVLRPTDEGAMVAKRISDIPATLGTAWKLASHKYDGSGMTNQMRRVFNVAGRVMETMSSPIMNHLVPRQKLGVFSRMAADWLAANPNAGSLERITKMQDIWESVDNRLGQMVYDNLFWDKTLKEASFLAVRSVGWNMGSIREIGGGLTDFTGAIKDKIAGREAEWTNRMSYLIAMTASTAITGAIMNRLFTGEGPKELKDYFFPRTGETRLVKLPGRNHPVMEVPERLSIPSYFKDIMAWTTQPGQTAKNKIHPLFSAMAQAWDNHDYYGDIIWNRDDPAYKQALDMAKFAGSTLIPFSITGTMKMWKERPGPVATMGMLGFQPAPGYIAAPEARQAWDDYIHAQEVRKKAARELKNSN